MEQSQHPQPIGLGRFAVMKQEVKEIVKDLKHYLHAERQQRHPQPNGLGHAAVALQHGLQSGLVG